MRVLHRCLSVWGVCCLPICIHTTAATTPPLLQIYVEIERARLTRQLARMKEQEGDIAEAAEILQEVAVVR